MVTQRSLSMLKAHQLKQVATCLGLNSTGTKAVLEHAIMSTLDGRHDFAKPPRIVSIDMGIKNLGLCVLEAPHLTKHLKATLDKQPASVNVLSWSKVDVLSQLSKTAKTGSVARSAELSKPDPSLFRPSSLAETALTITDSILRDHEPTHILIERQRFRSMGGSSVQEWTLRVNMLESMLYACFETMRAHVQITGARFPEVIEMSPARVARFWCGGDSTSVDAAFDDVAVGQSKTTKRRAADVMKEEVVKGGKIDKRAKIDVLRRWLAADEFPLPPHMAVQLHFSDQAQDTAAAFNTDTSSKKARKKREAASTDSGPPKLDDLADCLLQGVAWVRWEENKRKLSSLLSKTQP
jgi:cruciform cutting endonuclease 1